MKRRILLKSKLPELLDQLIRGYNVVAPIRSGDFVEFGRIQKAQDAVLDFYNSKTSPKYLFFPQSEVLFSYSDQALGSRRGRADSPDAKRANVIFGIRPCDARALLMLDKVFDQATFKDPYYVERRKNTVLVGLACLKPSSSAFCTSVRGGPFGEEGLDLLLADLGDRYLCLPLTPKGGEILTQVPGLEEATEKDEQQFAQAKEEATRGVSSRVKVEGVPEKLSEMFDHPVWERIHEKCIGCGTCTYLCPTCHCFDISDEKLGAAGTRIRLWDSCLYPLFTLHASGHNPRPTGRERMRQRVMHKFNYTVKNFGEIFCVGCGRCVRECPVNLDIRAVVNELAEVHVEASGR